MNQGRVIRFFSALFTLGVVVASQACSTVVDTGTTQCNTTADCVAKGPAFAGYVCSDQKVCVVQGGCSTNKDCIDAHAGEPWICRKTDRACVSLTANDCQPFAEPADIANDNTVWIGLMQPVDPKSANYTASQTSVSAAELARREISKLGPGLPPVGFGKPRRPLAILACNADTGIDPLPVAHYYADEVKTPAVMGFTSSGSAINIASNVSVNAGMMLITSFNDSPDLLTLNAGDPRLVWNCNPNSVDYTPPMGAIVSGVMEPQLRAQPAGPLKTPADQMRVAIAYNSNSFGKLVFANLTKDLTFNGKSVTDNGTNFLAVDYGDTDSPSFAPSQYTQAVAKITQFDAHAVVLIGSTDITDNLLTPLINQWPLTSDHKPLFVMPPLGSIGAQDSVLAMIKADLTLKPRILSAQERANKRVVDAFVLAFNGAFPDHQVAASTWDTLYDAVYVAAYSIVGAGDQPLTGAAMSRGITKLMPPGVPVDIGAGGIATAFNELSKGGSIDLNGSGNTLDWDPATGTPRGTYVVVCGDGTTLNETGLVYDYAQKKLVGTYACP